MLGKPNDYQLHYMEMHIGGSLYTFAMQYVFVRERSWELTGGEGKR